MAWDGEARGEEQEPLWAFSIERRRRAAAASVGELAALVSARGRRDLLDLGRACTVRGAGCARGARGAGVARLALYHAAVAVILARARLLEAAAGALVF